MIRLRTVNGHSPPVRQDVLGIGVTKVRTEDHHDVG